MREVTFTAMLRETLEEMMRRDSSIILMGEDIGAYGGSFGVTRGLLDQFGPERVRDTPISEQALTGCAIGAAVAGLKPIIEFMFMDFMTLGADQLINLAAKLHPIYSVPCPLVVRAPYGAGRGYGATHSQSLERLFFGTPGIKIVAPSNARDASALLQSALKDPNPVLFLEHKLLYPLRFQVPDALPPPLPIGFAKVVNEADDITIVAWGGATRAAMGAASLLADKNIGAEVIDLCTVSPFDLETLVGSAKKTGRMLIVEEGPAYGGVGAEIAAAVSNEAFEFLLAPICRIGAPNFPVPAARTLERLFAPDAAAIAEKASQLCR